MHIGVDASRAFLKERTGTEEYSYQLIKALVSFDRKNNYTLYVKFSPPVGGFNFPLPPNFQLKIIPFPCLWTQAGLALECFKNPPDVLFVPAHTLPILRRPKLKTVVTIHDLGAEFLPQYHQFPQKLYLNKATEYAVYHSTHLIAVSKSTRQDLIVKLRCDPQKISVIYEGFDNEKFKMENEKTSFDPELKTEGQSKIKNVLEKYKITPPYLLFVGTIQPRKNLVRLIEAFARVLAWKEKGKRSGGNLQLVIIGKKGWLYEEILAAPAKFAVEDQVRFLNFVSGEDLPVLYQNALCFVLPSLYEGFGLPVLEAMACGCPVVASCSSSLCEVVNGAGILFDPLNVEEISESLQLPINDLQLRRDLIKRGREWVKKFSWEKCARETLKILEKT